MAKRTVWAVEHSDYDEDRAIDALYEEKADAEAIVAEMGDDYRIRELHLYSSGDRSLPRSSSVHVFVDVSPEGEIADRMTITRCGHIGSEALGLQAPWVSAEYSRGEPTGTYTVAATLRTEEAAVNAVRERAARVAQMIADGLDPIANATTTED